MGCSKPDANIFQHVQEQLSGSQPIVFVDDAEQNLAMAKAIGWTTILADADHQWIDEVKALTSNSSPI
ncbi:D-glucose-1-phosphatase [compost metagenome]